MRISFCLSWAKAADATKKAFKSAAAYSLFEEYKARIHYFMPCEVRGPLPPGKSPVWVCEREKKSETRSSEALAKELQGVMNAGVSELRIVIGGPDGFTAQELDAVKPSFRWSFGPLTLPHELAAVVAAEQIYRALTILKNMPYHKNH